MYGRKFLFFRSHVSKWRRKVKKLDNEKHIQPAQPTYIQRSVCISIYVMYVLCGLVCAYFVCTCLRHLRILHTCLLQDDMQSETHNHHLNYILKALFYFMWYRREVTASHAVSVKINRECAAYICPRARLVIPVLNLSLALIIVILHAREASSFLVLVPS